jgi:hypothetical protein
VIRLPVSGDEPIELCAKPGLPDTATAIATISRKLRKDCRAASEALADRPATAEILKFY